jgi:hypothetical protein
MSLKESKLCQLHTIIVIIKISLILTCIALDLLLLDASTGSTNLSARVLCPRPSIVKALARTITKISESRLSKREWPMSEGSPNTDPPLNLILL